MPFHAKGRGLLRKMDTTSKAAASASGWTLLRSPVVRATCPSDAGLSPKP